MESGIQHLESGIHNRWNPESNTVLDYLTWGEKVSLFNHYWSIGVDRQRNSEVLE